MKMLRLNYVLKYFFDFAPKQVQKFVKAQELRYRVRNRLKLVPEKALFEGYREILPFLAERQGATSLGDYLEFGGYNFF
jgi:hypothetical protein